MSICLSLSAFPVHIRLPFYSIVRHSGGIVRTSGSMAGFGKLLQGGAVGLI